MIPKIIHYCWYGNKENQLNFKGNMEQLWKK